MPSSCATTMIPSRTRLRFHALLSSWSRGNIVGTDSLWHMNGRWDKGHGNPRGVLFFQLLAQVFQACGRIRSQAPGLATTR